MLAVGSRPAEEVSEVLSSCRVGIELPPFTAEEVKELFLAFGSTIGASELSILKELTAGNPLMVVETVRELSSTDDDESFTLSQKLSHLKADGLFAGRISRVSEPTRRFLRLRTHLWLWTFAQTARDIPGPRRHFGVGRK